MGANRWLFAPFLIATMNVGSTAALAKNQPDGEELGAEKQEETEEQAKEAKQRGEALSVNVKYDRPGVIISTEDGNWKTRLRWRLQSRYSYPTNSNPRTFQDFKGIDANPESSFELRRARMKIGGHGYRPWLNYYFEVDLQPGRDFNDSPADASTRLLTWRTELEKYKALSLRVGQWKIHFNRERVDSSGEQQFVERSIVNRIFTIDRQAGAQLYGHLFPGTLADMRYWAGVYTGLGRGVEVNDDDNMMYSARLQWNFLGRNLGDPVFSQSDVSFHEKPAGSIAGAISTNIGPCTRWSSSGCGSLDGFSLGEPSQFRIDQWVEEFAFKYRGLSIQHEFHWKQIEDRENDIERDMRGSYAQIGYFPHYLIPVVPKPLEVAFRYAFVDENTSRDNDERQEFTGALNWFFAGHNNKLTLDFSRLTLGRNASSVPTQLRPLGEHQTEHRARLQWDVTF